MWFSNARRRQSYGDAVARTARESRERNFRFFVFLRGFFGGWARLWRVVMRAAVETRRSSSLPVIARAHGESSLYIGPFDGKISVALHVIKQTAPDLHRAERK